MYFPNLQNNTAGLLCFKSKQRTTAEERRGRRRVDGCIEAIKERRFIGSGFSTRLDITLDIKRASGLVRELTY